MHIIRSQKVTLPILTQQISLSGISRTKKTASCEERDCCGNLIDDCIVPNVVVERECRPCCFYTWRPKIPVLGCSPPPKKPKQKYKKQFCFAGMKDETKTLAQLKQEAVECSKICGVKPICPPKPKIKAPREKPVKCPPIADWDHNGRLN